MWSDILGESQLLRRPWIWAKRRLPDLGNLPDALGWSASRGLEYLRERDGRMRAAIPGRAEAGGPGPRVIFSANPGRAGSAFLARLLATAPGVRAEHEPRPKMTGPYLEMTVERPLAESVGDRALKVRAVDRALEEMPGVRPGGDAGPAGGSGPVYAETSNMWIKTYWDVTARAWPRVDVVVLRRDPVAVLRSFQELGFFHPRNPTWPLWMADPVGPNRAVPPLWEAEERPGPGEARPSALGTSGPGTSSTPEAPDPPDALERSLAYLVDVEGRIAAVRRQLEGPDEPGPRFHDTTLEALLTEEGRRSLFRCLDLPEPPGGLAELPPANTREAWKAYFARDPASEGEIRGRLDDYRERLRRAGVALPEAVENW